MVKSSLLSKYKLPKVIKVNILKSQKGFTAKVENLPGCITYAEGVPELIENVNDAVLTYFEVPRKEADKVDFMYVPRPPAKSRSKVKKEQVREFVPVTSDFLYA